VQLEVLYKIAIEVVGGKKNIVSFGLLGVRVDRIDAFFALSQVVHCL